MRLYPEINLARRLVEKEQLKPPIDVFALTRQYADFEEHVIPADVDGICINLKALDRRPKILLQKNLSYKRKRFTLAHELGHLFIPWHVGMIVDHVDIASDQISSAYRIMEAEANRFAAELLMPESWVLAKIHAAENLAEATRVIAQTANVSMEASYFRTLQRGPPNYITVIEKEGIIIRSDATPSTKVRRPSRGVTIESIDTRAVKDHFVESSGQKTYHWFRLADEIQMPVQPKDDWRIILERMLESIPRSEKQKVQQSINAIIGGPLGKLNPHATMGHAFAQCQKVLQSRNDPNPYLTLILQHEELNDYVSARIYAKFLAN